MKPTIGIVANQYVFAENVFHNHPATYVPQFYVDSIYHAGGIPFVIPIVDEKSIDSYVDQFDGFLFTGGQGVSPVMYGEESMPKLGMTLLKRDKFEIALAKEVAKTNKPLLGICRGLQVINVAFGGTLYQHLDYRAENHIKHLQVPSPDTDPTHTVSLTKGSYLYSIFGPTAYVNSLHQQAIKKIAKNFTVIAQTSDNVVEAITGVGEYSKIFGVQWHPEMITDYDIRNIDIFKRLVSLAQ